MSCVNKLLFLLAANIFAQESLFEDEIQIHIINYNNTLITFSADRILANAKWYPTPLGPLGVLIPGTLYDQVFTNNLNYQGWIIPRATFDLEGDQNPDKTLVISKYKVSVVNKNGFFNINTLSWPSADRHITYDYTADKFYFGQCSPCNSSDEISPNNVLYGWDPPQDVSLLELYLTVSNQHGKPYLEWNPYHDPNILDYKIYKNLTTSSGTQTFNYYTSSTSYLDEMFEIDPKFGYDQVEYWITARISSYVESLEGNHVQIDGTSFIQWKISTQEINNEIDYRLNQNFPNPFNPVTRIAYSIKESGFVSLRVYDTIGNAVATLVNENKPAGSYSVNFDAGNLPSGMYIYRITSGKFTSSKKLILLKKPLNNLKIN